MSNRLISICFLLMFTLNASAIEEQIDANQPPVKPIRDGASIQGADGELSYSYAMDKWTFTIADIANNENNIAIGKSFTMLENSTLEKMVADYKKNQIKKFKIWASLTKFQNANKIYASYYIPLAKIEPTTEPNEPAAENIVDDDKNSLKVLPADIRKRLEPKKVVSTVEITAALESSKDAVIVNRSGFFKRGENMGYIFELDNLGRNKQDMNFIVLANQELELVVREMEKNFNPVRFKVSGIITRFEGSNYILLNNSAKALHYGNFAR